MADEAQTRHLTINGVTFQISAPYADGQTIGAPEAKALNQVRAENIGNNLRSKVKETLAADGNADEEGNPTKRGMKALQEIVAEKDAEYVLTVAAASGSSRSVDPVERESRALAKAAISAKLKEQGRKLKDVEKDELDAKIVEVAAREDFMARARENVQARSKLATASDIEI